MRRIELLILGLVVLAAAMTAWFGVMALGPPLERTKSERPHDPAATKTAATSSSCQPLSPARLSGKAPPEG